MRLRTLLFGIASAVLTACVPGSPIYFGPPLVTLSGTVMVFETRAPAARAEVCVFGTDTLCVASQQDGTYQTEMRSDMLLEGNALTVRFRITGLPTALAELNDVQVGEVTRVDCGISNRMTLSTEPVACLPIEP